MLIALGHLLALAGLVRALAPDLASQAVAAAGSIVSVTVTAPPEPEATPSPEPSPQPDEGAAGEEAPEAVARAVSAPEAPLPRPSTAPPAASTGSANTAGGGDSGQGTGAGGVGSGTGSGRFGQGRGGIPVTKPVKIAGDINAAADYPTPPGGRSIRWGHQVIVYMTVGVDGRAHDCHVVEASPDPEADRITCQLAEERFRFRPAMDANGNPVPATYGWKQWWEAER